jgi:hypothetical protein
VQIASLRAGVRERDRVDMVLLRLEDVIGLSETAALRQTGHSIGSFCLGEYLAIGNMRAMHPDCRCVPPAETGNVLTSSTHIGLPAPLLC